MKARGEQTYISSEDRLYKGLVHIDGGQLKKFTSHSSSRVLPLFYILLRVNIDVKIEEQMAIIQLKMQSTNVNTAYRQKALTRAMRS